MSTVLTILALNLLFSKFCQEPWHFCQEPWQFCQQLTCQHLTCQELFINGNPPEPALKIPIIKRIKSTESDCRSLRAQTKNWVLIDKQKRPQRLRRIVFWFIWVMAPEHSSHCKSEPVKHCWEFWVFTPKQRRVKENYKEGVTGFNPKFKNFI